MARIAASVAVFVTLLFFLFTFSSARDIHNPFFPPSESDAVPDIQGGPEITDVSKPLQQPDTVSVTVDPTELSDPVPLTFLNFHPINRRFPRRPLPLSFRLGHHHRCRHGNLLDPRRREIPYGNDAIVRSDAFKERSGFDPVNRGGVRQIPARWVRFHHVEPRFSEIRTHHHDHDHDHHHRHHEGEHEKLGWFMKKIRKFLNLF